MGEELIKARIRKRKGLAKFKYIRQIFKLDFFLNIGALNENILFTFFDLFFNIESTPLSGCTTESETAYVFHTKCSIGSMTW